LAGRSGGGAKQGKGAAAKQPASAVGEECEGSSSATAAAAAAAAADHEQQDGPAATGAGKKLTHKEKRKLQQEQQRAAKEQKKLARLVAKKRQQQQQGEEEGESADAAPAELQQQQQAGDEAAGSSIEQQQQQQRSRTPPVVLSPGAGRVARDFDGDSTTSAWTGVWLVSVELAPAAAAAAARGGLSYHTTVMNSAPVPAGVRAQQPVLLCLPDMCWDFVADRVCKLMQLYAYVCCRAWKLAWLLKLAWSASSCMYLLSCAAMPKPNIPLCACALLLCLLQCLQT
jgi:hypothetical protein